MSKSRPSPYNGLVLIDKEVGWTSHDVVAKARGVLGTRKVGHAGTLDPPATGLLLVGVGSMTRLLRFLTALPKTYVGEIVLGTETTTLDDTGDVTATHDMAGVTLADVRSAAEQLTGDIMQVPPMVSAVKIDGKRLHELAREGKEVERQPRPVTIHAFRVDEPTADGVYPVEVTCSSGTYIRTLAADLGTALGGGAHLRNLRRTQAGSHSVSPTPIASTRSIPTATCWTRRTLCVTFRPWWWTRAPRSRWVTAAPSNGPDSASPRTTTAPGRWRRRTACCWRSTARTGPERSSPKSSSRRRREPSYPGIPGNPESLKFRRLRRGSARNVLYDPGQRRHGWQSTNSSSTVRVTMEPVGRIGQPRRTRNQHSGGGGLGNMRRAGSRSKDRGASLVEFALVTPIC